MNERLFHAMLDGPSGFGLVGLEGTVDHANRALAEMLGRSIDDVAGTPLWHIGPGLGSVDWPGLRAEVGERGASERDVLGLDADGGTRWLRLRIEAAGGRDPSSGYLLRAERLPTAQTGVAPDEIRWLQTIARAGGDAFWCWQRGADTALVSPAWYAMLGLEPQARTGVDAIARRVHPDDKSAMTGALRRVNRGEAEQATARLRFRHADGRHHWTHHRAYIGARDARGRPTWLVGHVIDLGPAEPTETQALGGERAVSEVLDRQTTAVLLFAADGTLRQWNAAAVTMLGVSAGEMPAVTTASAFARWQAVDERGEPVAFEALPQRAAQRTGQPVRDRVIGFMRGGQQRWALVSAIPRMHASGEMADVVCTLTDITASRRQEVSLAARKHSESLGRLAGGVAHHFNNLLTVITTSADLLEHTMPVGSLAALDLEDLRAAAEQGAGLTRKLLGYASQQDRAPRELDLCAWLRDAHGRLKRDLPRGIALATECTTSPCPVNIDPAQVDQIVSTLLTNAGEAFDDARGTVQVEVGDARLEAGDPLLVELGDGAGHDFVVLRVHDHGRGMSPAVEQRATEPFFTTKTLGGASGLGLSACVGIARQNGGWMTIRSQAGSGTTVEVWLPSARAAAA